MAAAARWALVVGAELWGLLIAEAFRARGVRTAMVADRRPAWLNDDMFDRFILAADHEALAAVTWLAVLPSGELSVIEAERLAATLGAPTNDPARALARRHKHLIVEAAAAAGLAAPRQLVSASADAIAEWRTALGLDAVVIKPIDSQAGRGVSLCRSAAEIETAIPLALEETLDGSIREVVAQEWIAGREYYVNAVSRDGVHRLLEFWRAPKRRVGQHPFSYDRYDLVPPTTVDAVALRGYLPPLLDALGVRNGASHTEVRIGARGPVIVESGARLDGLHEPALSEAALGVSVAGVLAQAFADPDGFRRDAADVPMPRRYACRVGVATGTAGVLLATPGEALLRALPSYFSWRSTFTRGDWVPAPDLVGMVSLLHPDRAAIDWDIERVREYEAAGALVTVRAPDADATARIVAGSPGERAELDPAPLRGGGDAVLEPPLVWSVRLASRTVALDWLADPNGWLLRASLLGLEVVSGEPRDRWLVDLRAQCALPPLVAPDWTVARSRSGDERHLRVEAVGEVRAELACRVDGPVARVTWTRVPRAPEAIRITLRALLDDLGGDVQALVLGWAHEADLEPVATAARALRVSWPPRVGLLSREAMRATTVGLAPDVPEAPEGILRRYRARDSWFGPQYEAISARLGMRVELVGRARVYLDPGDPVPAWWVPQPGLLDVEQLREEGRRRGIAATVVQPRLVQWVRGGGRSERIAFDVHRPGLHVEAMARHGLVPVAAHPAHLASMLVDLAVDEATWLECCSRSVRRDLRSADGAGISVEAAACGDLGLDDERELAALAEGCLEDFTRPDERVFVAWALRSCGDDALVIRARRHGELIGMCLVILRDRVASTWVAWRQRATADLGVSAALYRGVFRAARERGCDIADLGGVWDSRFPGRHPSWRGFTEHKRRLGAGMVYRPPCYWLLPD